MSKKLPKDNLKKVSGAAAKKEVAFSKGVTSDALQDKKIAGGRNLMSGEAVEGKVARNKGIAREGFDNE